ncbi:VanZ family protein [Microvirga sp. ACRRW]|uniref:VanZ family protein n=1 Tax=Microvirga sp. ACRRW TaxID=2918205 RepID=UPI00351D8043
MPGGIEHALAYFGTATLFMLGYDKKGWETAVGLIAYSGLLEVLQLLVPGRTANFADMLASGSGALFGVTLWAVLLKQGSQQYPIRSAAPSDSTRHDGA